jgi:hypothetical protein
VERILPPIGPIQRPVPRTTTLCPRSTPIVKRQVRFRTGIGRRGRLYSFFLFLFVLLSDLQGPRARCREAFVVRIVPGFRFRSRSISRHFLHFRSCVRTYDYSFRTRWVTNLLTVSRFKHVWIFAALWCVVFFFSSSLLSFPFYGGLRENRVCVICCWAFSFFCSASFSGKLKRCYFRSTRLSSCIRCVWHVLFLPSIDEKGGWQARLFALSSYS